VYLNQPNRLLYPRPVDKKFGWFSTVRDYEFLYKLIQIIRPLIFILDRISIRRAKTLLVNGSYIGGVIENVYAKEVVNAPAGSYFYPQKLLYLNPHTAYQGIVRVGDFVIKKPYVLITNRHDPQKRFDYVISAMKKVLREYSKVSLVIPGPFTRHTKKLIDLTKKLGIEDKVLFLGKVSENDLQKLYRHSAVYCYPSPEEDFGLGPLEAGGWGVPTIAWNHAGPTVTVHDGVTGFLAKPYDVSEYAKAINKLLGDPFLRAKMGKAAWERTKNVFSWKNHIDTLEKSILQYT
jgi:glycosyltransferase involved in cell wall biosynthesis